MTTQNSLLSAVASSIVAKSNPTPKKNTNSFKSIATPFGKMWGYNGIITVSIQPNVNQELIKSLSDGAKIGEEEFMKAMVESTKQYFKKASYTVDNINAKTVMEMLPKKLVEDLNNASKLGMKKQYDLHFMKGESGTFYVILEAKKFIPNGKGGFNSSKAKPTGSNEIVWQNTNTDNSTFGEVQK